MTMSEKRRAQLRNVEEGKYSPNNVPKPTDAEMEEYMKLEHPNDTPSTTIQDRYAMAGVSKFLPQQMIDQAHSVARVQYNNLNEAGVKQRDEDAAAYAAAHPSGSTGSASASRNYAARPAQPAMGSDQWNMIHGGQVPGMDYSTGAPPRIAAPQTRGSVMPTYGEDPYLPGRLPWEELPQQTAMPAGGAGAGYAMAMPYSGPSSLQQTAMNGMGNTSRLPSSYAQRGGAGTISAPTANSSSSYRPTTGVPSGMGYHPGGMLSPEASNEGDSLPYDPEQDSGMGAGGGPPSAPISSNVDQSAQQAALRAMANPAAQQAFNPGYPSRPPWM